MFRSASSDTRGRQAGIVALAVLADFILRRARKIRRFYAAPLYRSIERRSTGFNVVDSRGGVGVGDGSGGDGDAAAEKGNETSPASLYFLLHCVGVKTPHRAGERARRGRENASRKRTDRLSGRSYVKKIKGKKYIQ